MCPLVQLEEKLKNIKEAAKKVGIEKYTVRKEEQLAGEEEDQRKENLEVRKQTKTEETGAEEEVEEVLGDGGGPEPVPVHETPHLGDLVLEEGRREESPKDPSSTPAGAEEEEEKVTVEVVLKPDMGGPLKGGITGPALDNLGAPPPNGPKLEQVHHQPALGEALNVEEVLQGKDEEAQEGEEVAKKEEKKEKPGVSKGKLLNLKTNQEAGNLTLLAKMRKKAQLRKEERNLEKEKKPLSSKKPGKKQVKEEAADVRKMREKLRTWSCGKAPTTVDKVDTAEAKKEETVAPIEEVGKVNLVENKKTVSMFEVARKKFSQAQGSSPSETFESWKLRRRSEKRKNDELDDHDKEEMVIKRKKPPSSQEGDGEGSVVVDRLKLNFKKSFPPSKSLQGEQGQVQQEMQHGGVQGGAVQRWGRRVQYLYSNSDTVQRDGSGENFKTQNITPLLCEGGTSYGENK